MTCALFYLLFRLVFATLCNRSNNNALGPVVGMWYLRNNLRSSATVYFRGAGAAVRQNNGVAVSARQSSWHGGRQ